MFSAAVGWYSDNLYDFVQATLLTIYSPLRIRLEEGPMVDAERGWMNLWAVGDTATGRSASVGRITKFLETGSIATGEITSKAGLVGSRITQPGHGPLYDPGQLARQNKDALVIDEAGQMDRGILRDLGYAMSGGVIKSSKQYGSEIEAQVRTIFISNPAHGKTMDKYALPIKASAGSRHICRDIYKTRSNHHDPERQHSKRQE